MGTRIFRFAGIFGVLLSSLLMNCEPLRDDSIPPSQRLAVNPDALNYYLIPYSSVAIDLKSVFTLSLVNLTVKISANPGRGKLVALPNFILRYDPSPSFLNGTDQFKLKIAETSKEVTIVLNVFASPESFPCGIYAMEERVCLNPASPAVVLFRANDVICGVPVAKVTASIYVKPEHGSAELKGDTLYYTPAPGYRGSDRLIYKLSTSGSLGFGGEALGIVTIPAEPVFSIGISEMHLPEGKVLDITYEASWAIACSDTVQVRIDGPGIYGVDYSTLPPAVGGVVKLPIETGKPSATIKVTSINDDLFEGSKTIRFQLMNSGSHVLPDTVTKLSVFFDDDEVPSDINFDSNASSIAEDDGAGFVATLKFSRPAESAGTITMEFSNGDHEHYGYGDYYTTNPTSENGWTITLDVSPGDAEASFQLLPLDNSWCGDQIINMYVLEVDGSIRKGTHTACTLLIQDDEESALVSFPGSVATLLENNVSGMSVQLLLSKPAPASSQITLFISYADGPGLSPRFVAMPPLYEDFYTGYYLYIDVAAGATSAQFLIAPNNNGIKDGNRNIYLRPYATYGCVQFATDAPFLVILQDDD